MHLLLPPSEGKRPGGRGRPLRTRQDDSPLAAPRRTAVDALAGLVAGDPLEAARALALPPGVAADALTADARVLDSPTMPALRRYAGVVYDGLALDRLTDDEQRLALRCCVVFSGLFGALRGVEPVPDYRVPAKAVLPGLGIVGTWWRPVLTEFLRPMLRRGLVVDLRSSDYRAMWRPDREQAERVLTVRVLSPLPRGGYGIVSFSSKLAKGRLAAALVRAASAGGVPANAADVLAAWRTCEGADPDASGPPAPDTTQLDVYTR